MGNVESYAKVDLTEKSRVWPGLCAQSEILDEHANENEFFGALVDLVHNRLGDVVKMWKKADVKSKGENFVEVLAVVDASMLGMKVEDGKDPLQRIVFRIDRAQGIIYEMDCDPDRSTGMIKHIGVTKVCRHPCEVVYLRQRIDYRNRRAAEGVAEFARDCLRRILSKDVPMNLMQPSPTDPPRPSVVTEPLDDDISPEKLWEGILNVMRMQSFSDFLIEGPMAVQLDIEEENTDDLLTYNLCCLNSAEKARKRGHPLAPELEVLVTRAHVRVNKKAKRVCLLVSTQDFFIIWMQYIQLLQDPLRLEFWRFTPEGAPPDDMDRAKESLRYVVNIALHNIKHKDLGESPAERT